MGYAFAVSACIGCGMIFTYNPVYVPSLDVNGNREPVCPSCFEWRQNWREENGLEREPLHPDAYEPCPEEELGY